jgi:hypothetical protein
VTKTGFGLVIGFIGLFCIQLVTTLHNSLLRRTHIQLVSIFTSSLPLLDSGFRHPTADLPLPLGSRNARYSNSNRHVAFQILQITTAQGNSGSRLHTLYTHYCAVGSCDKASGPKQHKTSLLLRPVVEFRCCRG